MAELINRIIKTELIDWRQLSWFQGNLKEISENSLAQLKNSLKEKNFIQSFNVWEEKPGKIWILDGHHRKKAMELIEQEGTKIPDRLTASFIECANKKEAVDCVLAYSSIYANPSNDGLAEFLKSNGRDISGLNQTINIPSIDIDRFIKWYGENDNKFKDIGFEGTPQNGMLEIIITMEPHRFDAILKDTLDKIERDYQCQIQKNEPE